MKQQNPFRLSPEMHKLSGKNTFDLSILDNPEYWTLNITKNGKNEYYKLTRIDNGQQQEEYKMTKIEN